MAANNSEAEGKAHSRKKKRKREKERETENRVVHISRNMGTSLIPVESK